MDTLKLHDIYYSPLTGYHKPTLYSEGKKLGFTKKQIDEFLNQQEITQIFTPKKKKFTKIVGHTNADYQMDVMFLEQYRRQNKGFIGLVTFIEITSRKVYAIPIKNKNQETINEAFDVFYKGVHATVNNITTDNEASFKNAIKRYPEITHWLTDPGDKHKTGKIERFNRTIREMINKYMKINKTANWIDVIPDLIKNYNNRVHSATGQSPNSFKKKDYERVQSQEQFLSSEAIDEINSFNIGDQVRLLKQKDKFEKGSDEFTSGVYTIIDKHGLSFKLRNPKGETVKRNVKNWEIKKVTGTQAPKKQNTSFSEINKANKFVRKQRAEDLVADVNKDTGEIQLPKRLQPQVETKLRKRKPNNQLNYLKMKNS